MSQTVYCLSAS